MGNNMLPYRDGRMDTNVTEGDIICRLGWDDEEYVTVLVRW